MSKIQELLERKETVFREMRELRGRLDPNTGKFSDDDQAKWDKADSDWQTLTTQIENEKAWEARQKEALDLEYQARQRNAGNTSATQVPQFGQQSTTAQKEQAEARYNAAFSAYLRSGMIGITPEQRAILEQEQRGTATQITTTDSLGGYAVPTGFSNELERILKFYGPMLTAARIFPTSSGNLIEWPTLDQTSNKGSIQTTEGGTVAVSDLSLGVVNLGAFTFVSDIVKLSNQMIQDEAVDLTGILPDLLAERLGRNINEKLTTGTGTNQPTGVVTAATLGKTAASATAFTMNELIDTLHSVDIAYRMNPKSAWMMHDLIMAAIRKLAVGASDAQPLWQASFREDQPDRLLGKPVLVNNDMASTLATTNKIVLFGDFSKYVVRTAGGITVKRTEERYFEELAVGYVAHRRLDAKLIASGAVKYLQLA